MTASPIRRALPPAFAQLAGMAIIGLVARQLAMAPRPALPPPPAWIGLQEASTHSGLSAALLRRLIAGGKLRAVRDGRSIKVFRANLDNLDTMAEMAQCGQKLCSVADDLRATLQRRKA